MKRHIQREPLLIQQLELTHWAIPVHTHDFYELIMIREGQGHHIINGNRFSYSPGDVFLLGPTDYHLFSLEQPTSFYFISFTELYAMSLTALRSSIWKRIKEYSLHTVLGFTGNLITNPTDQLHLNTLLSILISENNDTMAPPAITDSLMGAILSLLERRIAHLEYPSAPTSLYSADLVQKILAYISQHITQPDQLRIEQLADLFHYSPGHLSALFKQQVGESLQQYIIQYRLKLVEKRLRLSSLTISQIADEFGFTDICHLNKLFKRYYQHTPMVYRRAIAVS